MIDPIQTKRTQLLRRALVWIGFGVAGAHHFMFLEGRAAPPKGGTQKKEGLATKWRKHHRPKGGGREVSLLLGGPDFFHLLWMVLLSLSFFGWGCCPLSPCGWSCVVPSPPLGGAVFPPVACFFPPSSSWVVVLSPIFPLVGGVFLCLLRFGWGGRSLFEQNEIELD